MLGKNNQLPKMVTSLYMADRTIMGDNTPMWWRPNSIDQIKKDITNLISANPGKSWSLVFEKSIIMNLLLFKLPAKFRECSITEMVNIGPNSSVLAGVCTYSLDGRNVDGFHVETYTISDTYGMIDYLYDLYLNSKIAITPVENQFIKNLEMTFFMEPSQGVAKCLVK